MTLDDLELYKFEFSENFAGFRTFPTDQQLNEWRDQYCQRQRCKHVELEQFLACFRVSRVCQRQLGFLVLKDVRPTVNTVFIDKHFFSSVLMLCPTIRNSLPSLVHTADSFTSFRSRLKTYMFARHLCAVRCLRLWYPYGSILGLSRVINSLLTYLLT